jgi:hypothetical protein
VEKDYLVLKRASASRPSGEWSDDDYDVLADGFVVGRIFKVNAAPVGQPWMQPAHISSSEKGSASGLHHWRCLFVKKTLLVQQRKGHYGRGARPVVSCTCDG